MWSYRANPPMADRETAIPFDSFLSMLGLADGTQVESAPEVTDEEIEELMKRGRMGWIPPGG